MLKEEEVRKRVKALKGFYMDLINFAVVNIILILIWFTFDKTGAFWPKYVLAVWGIVLIYRAFRMGIIPLIFHRSSFLTPDWEEKKVREIMRRRAFHRPPPSDKNKKEK